MILSDCYRSCPFRSNVSSNPYHSRNSLLRVLGARYDCRDRGS